MIILGGYNICQKETEKVPEKEADIRAKRKVEEEKGIVNMKWNDDVWGVNKSFKFGTGEVETNQSKKVYFEFSLKMKPEWFTWHPNAKDRFVRHFQRKHASDTYQGNIDFDVSASDWDRSGIFGEGTFIVPAEYTEDIKTKTDYREVAEDALSIIMSYDLSQQERDLIDDYKVDKITT